MSLPEKIAAAKAELARLELMAAGAPCREVGHRWKSLGGCNAQCECGGCSVPVHECTVCGDCDYGNNHWAAEVRDECRQRCEMRRPSPLSSGGGA